MQIIKRILIACGFVLPLSFSLALAAADDLDALRAHLDSRRSAEAWALAEKLELQRAGNADFDFLYAQAALAAGHPSQAIFALARIRLRQPGQQPAWLLLVRAHLEAGDSVRARSELDALLASAPSAAVRLEAQQLALRLSPSRMPGPARGFIGLDIGYDSNVNSATDAVSVTGIGGSPTTGIVLTPSDRAQHDSFARLYASYGGRVELGAHASLFADASGYANTLYDQTQFSTSLYQGRVGAGWQSGAHRLALPLSRQDFSIGHRRYSTYDTAGVEWSYARTAAHRIIVAVSRGLARYIDQPTRDSRFSTAALGWTTLAGRTQLGVNVRYGLDDPRVDFNETLSQSNAFMGRQSYVLGIDASYRWRPRHMPRLSLLLQSSRHDDTDPDFAVRRRDHYALFVAGWDWRVRPDWMLRADLNYAANRSTIDLYDYDKLQLVLGVRHDFH